MPVNKNQYVIVNIWTSEFNESLPGDNVGHVSLTIYDGTNETYVSLWPGRNKQPYTLGMSEHLENIERKAIKAFYNFIERPASYQPNYERDCILEARAEDDYRPITNITECRKGETPYRFDSSTWDFVRLTEQPRAIRPTEQLLAIKLIPANFRVVLFSLNVNDILDEFQLLKNPDHITGWKMAGSNFFTRNINTKTSENCASIAYRCLNAGGLYSHLGSKHSAPLSSAVSPDDLLRLIVAVKVIEKRQYWGEIEDWRVSELEETPIDSIIAMYKEKGQDANATNDVVPSSKPSMGGCSIM